MLKAIILDMDGTITRSNHLHALAYDRLFHEFGKSVSLEEYFEKYVGQGAKAIMEGVLGQEQYDYESCLEKKNRYLLEVIDEQDGVETVPGIEKFIDYVEGQGWRLGVASGATLVTMEKILDFSGIKGKIEKYISAHEVKNNKPAPDVYLEILKRMSLGLAEVVVFEDSVAGVRSATSAGLKCIGLKTTTAPELLIEAGAVMLVEDYNDLLNQLEKNKNLLINLITQK